MGLTVSVRPGRKFSNQTQLIDPKSVSKETSFTDQGYFTATVCSLPCNHILNEQATMAYCVWIRSLPQKMSLRYIFSCYSHCSKTLFGQKGITVRGKHRHHGIIRQNKFYLSGIHSKKYKIESCLYPFDKYIHKIFE